MKCRFSESCELYRSDAYTCQHDDEVDGYCGKFKELNQQNIELVLVPTVNEIHLSINWKK